MFERLAARSFEAMNRKDLPGVMRFWADDGVFEFPGHTPISGRIVGKPAIEAWFRRYFDRMASVRFTVRRAGIANPVGLTYSNTLYIEWDVDLTSVDGVTIHTSGVGVYTVRRGKLISVKDYVFDPSIGEAIWGRAETPATGVPLDV